MTGAMLPRGCDCVLQHERTDNGLEQVQIYAALSPHDNYCDRGEDYRTGEVLLPAGTVVDAAAVGVLASAGLSSVPVRRRPVVRVLSTGDEVVSPDLHPLPAGKIYGSNQELLTARLRELGVSDVKGLLIGDDPREVADAMAQLLGECDLLITTGGVSAGDKDIFHEALPLLGAERVFWKVNLKPGTPAMYSLWQGQPILSLSGNPFAAAATFELLARPLLAALTGESRFSLRSRTAVVEGSFPKASPGRRFLRGFYQEGRVSLTGKNDSGMLASLVGCNCLVDISPPALPRCRRDRPSRSSCSEPLPRFPICFDLEVSMEPKFNHFDAEGNAVMVDVSAKSPTRRLAVAQGKIKVSRAVLDAITGHTAAKGDVLGVAQVAGILATKRTSELIPLCHPLALSHCTVEFTILHEECAVLAECTAKLDAKTGVEMEALTGVSVALLTIYDMCKAIDKTMEILTSTWSTRRGASRAPLPITATTPPLWWRSAASKTPARPR